MWLSQLRYSVCYDALLYRAEMCETFIEGCEVMWCTVLRFVGHVLFSFYNVLVGWAVIWLMGCRVIWCCIVYVCRWRINFLRNEIFVIECCLYCGVAWCVIVCSSFIRVMNSFVVWNISTTIVLDCIVIVVVVGWCYESRNDFLVM